MVCYKTLMVSSYNLVQHLLTQSSGLLGRASGIAVILTTGYKKSKEHCHEKKNNARKELLHTLKLYCLEIAAISWAKLINHLHGFHGNDFFK